MFIDTHAHFCAEDNINLIVSEAVANKVNIIIASGCDKKGINQVLELINDYDNIYATIGFHPDEVDNVSDEDIEWLEKLVENNKKIIGIGEMGLDYYYTKDKKEEQKDLFIKQLDLAKKLNLPVVIHSREATEDMLSILSEYKLKGIMHCFSGSLETARKYISMGYYIGIGGVVTFKNSKLQDIVREVCLENMVLETDSPYLAPDPFRGKQNSPKYISLIASKIAEIKGIEVEKLGEITTLNAKQLFDLK